ncbi:MAG: hypothetical protein ACFCVD_22195 [Nodosilinea sp.]
MNTPSHLVLNLAILRRPGPLSFTWPILLGALAPDVALFVFYGWARWGQHLPAATIWGEAYYSQPWQDIFALGNSIPLALVSIALGVYVHQPALALFAASMGLHHLEDLPLHNDDAHRHFWPFSDRRIISPVSYWDVNHHGLVGASLELGLVLIASVYLWRRLDSRVSRAILGLTTLGMLAGYWGLSNTVY